MCSPQHEIARAWLSARVRARSNSRTGLANSETHAAGPARGVEAGPAPAKTRRANPNEIPTKSQQNPNANPSANPNANPN
eukprot:5484958-Pyramimonas_sp.AAC.1